MEGPEIGFARAAFVSSVAVLLIWVTAVGCGSNGPDHTVQGFALTPSPPFPGPLQPLGSSGGPPFEPAPPPVTPSQPTYTPSPPIFTPPPPTVFLPPPPLVTLPPPPPAATAPTSHARR